MTLFLSSYRLGSNPCQFPRLLPPQARVAVVINAQSGYPDPTENYAREASSLIELGLVPELLDLKDYFEDTPGLLARLTAVSAVWVLGGNTFTLRTAMLLSGFDVLLPKLLSDGLLYAGYSAGACVLSPSLRGLDIVDDPLESFMVYGQHPTFAGLGILDVAFIPHYKSEHDESALVDSVIEFLEENNMPYVTCRDGDAQVIRDHAFAQK